MTNLSKFEKYVFSIIAGLGLLGIVVGCSRPSQPVASPEVLPLFPSTSTSPTASVTLPPTCCFGVFVAFVDRYTGNDNPTTIRWRDGVDLYPRVYIYSVGEPITVTATVLVFDEGGLILTEGRFLSEYTISVTDKQARQLPMTEQGKQVTGTDRVPHIGGIVVERNTPYIGMFRIDEWFDFSRTGVYTFTLTRRVWVAGTSHTITSNAVSISIIPPPSAP